jgi:uncharacterized protein
MEKSSPSLETASKAELADPTSLGVFGLAIVTLVAASSKMGWTEGTAYVLPWALFLGSFAQLYAATVDFKKNNFFGATVLGAYGLFWMGVCLHWAMALGWFGEIAQAADGRPLAFACLGFGIFSMFVFVAACEVNKVFALILFLINILLPSLALSILGIQEKIFHPLAAYSELGISVLSFYASGALFLNNFFRRQILPLGRPCGFLKRSA